MVAVDSSIIIHLARIGKLKLLKSYFNKIKITQGVQQEIIGKESEEIRKSLGKWIEVKEIKSEKSNILSATDMELINLAEKEKDLILTNDGEIIARGKIKGVETMWLTTFLLLCLKKKLVDKKEARQILYDLVKHGCYIRIDTYATVQKLIEEME